jgi:hypothetical protein
VPGSGSGAPRTAQAAGGRRDLRRPALSAPLAPKNKCVRVPQRAGTRGDRKKTRENDVHLRQLAKKSAYVPSLFFFFSAFWAFIGKRQEEFENTRKQIECVSKKIAGEIFFRGGNFFPGDFF